MKKMNRSGRLKPIANLARHRELGVVAELRQYRQTLEESVQRLEDLELYRSEYIKRYQQVTLQGAGIDRINSYRLFLGKLDAVVRQQIETVDNHHRLLEEKTAEWRRSRTDRLAVDKAVERRIEDEEEVRERNEQKAADDRVQGRRSSTTLD